MTAINIFTVFIALSAEVTERRIFGRNSRGYKYRTAIYFCHFFKIEFNSVPLGIHFEALNKGVRGSLEIHQNFFAILTFPAGLWMPRINEN